MHSKGHSGATNPLPFHKRPLRLAITDTAAPKYSVLSRQSAPKYSVLSRLVFFFQDTFAAVICSVFSASSIL